MLSSPFLLRSLLLDRLFSDPGNATSSILIDWKETSQAHDFTFDLPGLTKEDVNLQIHDDRVLHLSAADKKEAAENEGEACNKEKNGECNNNVKWHRRERSNVRSLRREFKLPENALVDQIKAEMRDGVLVVTVPKDKSKKNTALSHKKKKKKHVVEIEDEDQHGSGKGLGRFVCCKA